MVALVKCHYQYALSLWMTNTVDRIRSHLIRVYTVKNCINVCWKIWPSLPAGCPIWGNNVSFVGIGKGLRMNLDQTPESDIGEMMLSCALRGAIISYVNK